MADGMNGQGAIAAWMEHAPQGVREKTDELLAEVEGLRDEETIYPPQDDVLNALAFTAPEDVRVVVLGQDPYHGPGQAMGLAFSVPEGQKVPPSLRNIFKELAADAGCAVPPSGDLTPWARRGVLLLNTTLTVREHAANSHSKLGWQTLTTYVVEECMCAPQPVVFLAWGRPAVKLIEAAKSRAEGAAALLQGEAAAQAGQAVSRKFVLKSTHPSPLSASRAAGDLPAFLGSRPFSRANEFLRECGEEPIDWSLSA